MMRDLFGSCRCGNLIEAPERDICFGCYNAQQERDANNLIGLAVRMPKPCPRCRGTHANLGAGRGPHVGSLMCACGRHLGWVSHETYAFLSATVRRFGRPTSPIQIRRRCDASSASSDVDARRHQLSIEKVN